jgi:hypothetical protein
MQLEPQMIVAVMADRDRKAMEALMAVYGDDVSTILNGLHAMAARLAIASGVSPEDFTAGVKHHWDFLADALNDDAPVRSI